MRKETHSGTKTLLLHYESCGEYADHVAKYAKDSYNFSSSSWCEGGTWGEAIENARRGTTDLVEQAERLLDKIVVEAQRERLTWRNEVAGAFPSIPDYLAGQPDCMLDMDPQPDSRAPIRIFVELTSSGGISAADMTKRGTAILALALLLNMERAVTLNVIIGFGRTPFGHEGSFAVIPLGTSPIDIALACNALTSQAFVRRLGYALMKSHPESLSGGNWDWDLNPDSTWNRNLFVAKLRAALGGSPTDIFIPPSFINDPAISDPLGFVQRSLADALKVERDEA